MALIQDLGRLTLFRSILATPPISLLLAAGDGGDVTGCETEQPIGRDTTFARDAAAAEALYRLVTDATVWRTPEASHIAPIWDAWLIHHIITDENPWTLHIEGGQTPGPLLTTMAEHDLRLIAAARPAISQRLARAAGISDFRDLSPNGATGMSADATVAQPVEQVFPEARRRAELSRAMAAADDWGPLTKQLAALIRVAMAGPYNTALAFRFEGTFIPVFSPDPIRLEHLTGYEKERERVIANTERLLRGLPAHNLLLYGDRGTGKSATVKALLHRYGPEGLRIVEVPKGFVHALPDLVRDLGRRGARFIIFIDDLSFETDETEYKELKAALEGSLEPMPGNVRIYATSNRRHLITETFADRRGGAFGTAADEVRSQDGMQEKLSLADRFGQTVIFPTPSQRAYLDIVYALAKRHGITIPEDELATQALRWATWHNGRSARTARQFVDSLIH